MLLPCRLVRHLRLRFFQSSLSHQKPDGKVCHEYYYPFFLTWKIFFRVKRNEWSSTYSLYHKENAKHFEQLFKLWSSPGSSEYRKFPNSGAGRLGKTLGGAIIRERTFTPSSGFLQNENRIIFG